MPRRKPQIEAYRYEWKGGVGYDIYFPGSKQKVSVVANELNHWQVKKLLFAASKISLSLFALNGKTIPAAGRVFRITVGRYIPIEGECLRPECPNFYALFSPGRFDPAEVWIYFQRRETSTKAVALAVALSTRVEYTKFVGGGRR